MKRFAELITALDQTTKTNAKLAALKSFFEEAPDKDKLWCVALLSHKRPKRTVKTADIRAWAAEIGNLPLWLFEDSYHVVGDLAETVALILPPPSQKIEKPLHQWIEELIALGPKTDEEKKEWVLAAWDGLDKFERFVFNKLITGGFRIGVSQKNITKALAAQTGREENVIAHRMMGNWSALDTTFEELILSDAADDDYSKPYPFYLAYAVEGEVEDLGEVSDWQVERKWDGIRGQLIKRGDEVFVWSRGEELVTEKFPELVELGRALPDGTVLDGEIICFENGAPMSFAVLQTRIGRKNVSKKYLTEAPVKMICYDAMEIGGQDIREKPQNIRRLELEGLHAGFPHPNFLISEIVDGKNWAELKAIRANSRAHQCEGLMLKHKHATYKVGRKRGDWWKWKEDPLTIDAVLIYAMRGHGRRANLYTDYTFAVWKGEALVPFAKAYSGLTDAEFRKVDSFVKKHTKERFGPVRSVDPELVFELAFEGIAKSSRHKSGVALRFPRMKRWRQDKPAAEANTYEDLMLMLEKYG